MNKPKTFGICGIAILISIAAFFQLSHKASTQSGIVDSNRQSPSDQEKAPPPPPPPPTGTIAPLLREPQRILVGVTEEGLSGVKQLLTNQERIATYPIDNSHEKAALSYTDLDGDGKPEVIFVHTSGDAATTKNIPLLKLDVVTNNGESPTKRFSVQLAGMYVYANIYDQAAAPFDVRDITGDGRPEIFVTSAVGASIGATLQAFSFNGESLREIAKIEGHHFEIVSNGAGKAAVIRSRWKDEQTVQTFVWNGAEFKEVKQ
ncbi:MAG TPA: FG-GAP-like repeat-containing protein [Blastocatellia bacterium]|nr:FG-GAP-like repeat-containing protein [Blastocatellia bacterium]